MEMLSAPFVARLRDLQGCEGGDEVLQGVYICVRTGPRQSQDQAGTQAMAVTDNIHASNTHGQAPN